MPFAGSLDPSKISIVSDDLKIAALSSGFVVSLAEHATDANIRAESNRSKALLGYFSRLVPEPDCNFTFMPRTDPMKLEFFFLFRTV